MEPRLFIFLFIFLAFTVLLFPAIFNYAAMPYFIIMVALIGLDNVIDGIIYIAPVIFFVAFYLELRWSEVSLSVNAEPFMTSDSNEKQCERI